MVPKAEWRIGSESKVQERLMALARAPGKIVSSNPPPPPPESPPPPKNPPPNPKIGRSRAIRWGRGHEEGAEPLLHVLGGDHLASHGAVASSPEENALPTRIIP